MKHKHRNLRKAAVLVASLDDENAEAILRQMSPGQAHALRQAVEHLGDVDPAEQNEVIHEFFRIGPLLPDKQPAGIELDGQLPNYLSSSPAQVETVRADKPRASQSSTFRFLQEASAQSLGPFLEREHPQTIAVVVSHLPSERAAEVLAGLSDELQIDVARRLVDLDETDPEVLREVEQGLESWLCDQVRSNQRRAAGITALNNILGAASPWAKQSIMANLARHDRHLVSRIKTVQHSPLTFAQLEHLDPASLTVVLHHADSELLVLALAGAGAEFAERVFELFPREESELLRAHLRALGPTRLSDVEEAQGALAELAGQLEMRGEIAPDVRGRLSVAV
jgi:flagellar motor switch protein FliG